MIIFFILMALIKINLKIHNILNRDTIVLLFYIAHVSSFIPKEEIVKCLV